MNENEEIFGGAEKWREKKNERRRKIVERKKRELNANSLFKQIEVRKS